MIVHKSLRVLVAALSVHVPSVALASKS